MPIAVRQGTPIPEHFDRAVVHVAHFVDVVRNRHFSEAHRPARPRRLRHGICSATGGTGAQPGFLCGLYRRRWVGHRACVADGGDPIHPCGGSGRAGRCGAGAKVADLGVQ